jgi:hypothetical protein
MNQSETIIACGGHVCERIGMKLAIFRGPSIDDPTKFRLKPLGQMNRSLVGSISGRSSKECLFRSDPLSNMAATDNSCF